MKLTLLPFGSDDMKDAIEVEIPDSSCLTKVIKEREFERAKKVFENSVSSRMVRAKRRNIWNSILKI